MARPLLFVRHGASANASFEVFKVGKNGLTESMFTYGNNTNYVPQVDARPVNLAIHWGPNIYAIAPEDGIYKYEIATQTVTKIHSFAFPSLATNSAGVCGFFPVVRDGTNQLVCGYTTSVSGVVLFCFVEADDTVTESNNQSFGTTGTNLGRWCNNAFLYANKIYFHYQTTNPNDGITAIFDPVAGTLSTKTNNTASDPLSGSSSYGCVSWTVQSGSLYGVIDATSAGVAELGKMNGLNAISKGTWTVPSTLSNSPGRQSQAFVHNDIIYNIQATDTLTWAIYQLWQDENGDIVNAVDVTSAVFGFNSTPSALGDRFFALRDIETSPGVFDTILVTSFNADAAGSPFDLWKFNGGNQAATYLGSAGDGFDWAPVRDHVGGGHYTFSASGELTWTFKESIVVGKQIQIKQTIDGVVPSGSVILGMVFNNNFTSPTDQAILVATDQGSLSGNFVTGLSALGSGNVITTTWAAVAQGIVAGDCPIIDGRLQTV